MQFRVKVGSSSAERFLISFIHGPNEVPLHNALRLGLAEITASEPGGVNVVETSIKLVRVQIVKLSRRLPIQISFLVSLEGKRKVEILPLSSLDNQNSAGFKFICDSARVLSRKEISSDKEIPEPVRNMVLGQTLLPKGARDSICKVSLVSGEPSRFIRIRKGAA